MALTEAREYTKSLYAHLTLDQRRFPCRPGVNPPAWELGHIGWFQEFWCRRQTRDDPLGAHTPSRIATADAWWNSSIVPHATRWTLPLPEPDGIDAWLDATLADTLSTLASTDDGDHYFFELALYHEDMHAETLLMTLQSLALPLPPRYASMPRVGTSHATLATGRGTMATSHAAIATDVHFEGGCFDMGADPAAAPGRFVFDNEKWSHAVQVRPFAIATVCVTNAQFAAFVDAGGYTHRAFWNEAGWAWRCAVGATHPSCWRRDTDGWSQRRFDRWLALDPAEPVIHVNAWEAEAYCQYAGRRLPTEAEWEFAARHTLPGNEGVLDLAQITPALPPQRAGIAHLLGDVWEWTSSAFEPYPGFAADPYVDYSAPWFGDHRVLRGGSFATRSRLVHAGFRNFYRPERTDVFAGFRTCALQHETAQR